MSEQDEKNSNGFKVNDRRLFDEHGNERDGVEEKAKTEPQQDFVIKDSPKTEEQKIPEEITFASFVMSFAMQAFIQLGEMEAPEGFNVPRDKAAARQTIDILRLLESKTKGNLDPDEEMMLKDVLQKLQFCFVKAK